MRFLCVYILEAHADDEWPIRTRPELVIRQHRSLSERLTAAKRLLASRECLMWPVVLDTMGNEFNRAYSAWPVRGYIVDGRGRIVHILGLRNMQDQESGASGYYDFKDFEPALRKLGVGLK